MSVGALGFAALATALVVPAFGQAMQEVEQDAHPAVQTFAGKSKAVAAKAKATAPSAKAKPAALVPLNERERTQQMLNRFSFGARPGDVERVMTQRPDKWFEQQMQPDAIPDPLLDKRLRG